MVFAIALLVTLALIYLPVKRATPLASPGKIELTVEKGEPLRVSFIGDSMDYGLFSTEQRLGFHQLVVSEWRTSGPVTDQDPKAIGGTAGDVLTTSEFPQNQQLYVVTLGTEDAARVDRRLFRTQYERVLDRLRSASPDAALLCIGVWRPKEVADIFDTIIKDLCEVRGGVFRSISDLSMNEQLKGPAGVFTFAGLSDNLHPNDLGHRQIADRVLDAVVLDRQG